MYAKGGKRALDVIAATVALLLLSPLLLILAIGARVASPGPSVFRQTRIGRDGRPFQFYKFRSMPANTGDIASDRIGQIEIGKFGRVIRRTSLDELPQLFNVLRGDMSLIGPRPPIVSQQELIAARAANGALGCRPGLTGLAQVNSFDGMSVAEKARFDGVYASRVTFLGDLRILFRTIGYLRRPPPVY